MNTDDRARTVLHERLDKTLGPEAADTMMGYLPPVGWADVVTTRDLDAATTLLRTEIHTEIAGLRAEMGTRFAEMDAGFERALRQAFTATVAAMATIVALAVALNQLLG